MEHDITLTRVCPFQKMLQQNVQNLNGYIFKVLTPTRMTTFLTHACPFQKMLQQNVQDLNVTNWFLLSCFSYKCSFSPLICSLTESLVLVLLSQSIKIDEIN